MLSFNCCLSIEIKIRLRRDILSGNLVFFFLVICMSVWDLRGLIWYGGFGFMFCVLKVICLVYFCIVDMVFVYVYVVNDGFKFYVML